MEAPQIIFTKQTIGILAGILAFTSYVFYIGSILLGKTKPNRASWWVWASLGFVLFTSYIMSGAKETIWAPLSEAIGPLLAAVLSLKYGEGGWTPFDLKCLGGVALSILLWLLFNSPLIALLCGLTIDLFAALPTIKKAYWKPHEENLTAWVLVVLANALNIFAVEHWTFAIAIVPIYTTGITGAILIPLLLPRNKIRQV